MHRGAIPVHTLKGLPGMNHTATSHTTPAAKRIHRAHGPFEDDKGVVDPAGQWWVSINGNQWAPVDREPETGDYDDIVALFAPREMLRDGKVTRFVKITFAKRYVIGAWGANATLLDPIEVA